MRFVHGWQIDCPQQGSTFGDWNSLKQMGQSTPLPSSTVAGLGLWVRDEPSAVNRFTDAVGGDQKRLFDGFPDRDEPNSEFSERETHGSRCSVMRVLCSPRFEIESNCLHFDLSHFSVQRVTPAVNACIALGASLRVSVKNVKLVRLLNRNLVVSFPGILIPSDRTHEKKKTIWRYTGEALPLPQLNPFLSGWTVNIRKGSILRGWKEQIATLALFPIFQKVPLQEDKLPSLGPPNWSPALAIASLASAMAILSNRSLCPSGVDIIA
uniref:Uncharacterized protein n=1 Tax=Steinernema glaseri TaxID=37863 RepID=A0A1I7Z5C2_9BILA